MSNRPAGQVSFDNQGRVVLVTGAAGGIGSAIAIEFHKSNAVVFALDVIDSDKVDLPDGIHYAKLDVTDEAAVEALVQQVVVDHGGIDVLVNNAAIQPVSSFTPVHEIDTELWNKILAVNMTGYTLMAKYVIRTMLKQQSGAIVNLASAHAHRTSREVPAYGPTKAANRMQALQWAIEYARHGIRVMSVSPGAIDTPMVRASLELQGGEGQLANRHPLGRLGKPEEIAGAVMWLASRGASFVTATDLEVDGGLGGFGSFADPYTMDS